jgi:putative DNA primase/helicase
MSDVIFENAAAAQTSEPFEFVLFRSIADTVPSPQKSTIPQFVERFSKPAVLTAKGGPAWSPAVYLEGVNRSKSGVAAVTALVMDVDDGTPIKELHRKLEGYAYFWHTSYSHTPEHPKYRIVVFLAAPVPAAQWGELWLRAQAWMGGHLDPATKDALACWLRCKRQVSVPVDRDGTGGTAKHFQCNARQVRRSVCSS